MKKRLPSILVFAVIALSFSCSKRKDTAAPSPDPTPAISVLDTTRLQKVHFYYSSQFNSLRLSVSYAISYTSDDKPDHIDMTDELGTAYGWNKKSFTYSSGSYLINELDSPGVFYQTTVMVDGNGMITGTTGNSQNFTAGYDNKKVIRYNDKSYQWANDDISYMTVPRTIFATSPPYHPIGTVTDTAYFQYDNQHRGQTADAFQIDDFLRYGRSIIRTYDLLKEDNVHYTFDDKGRITEYTIIAEHLSTSVYDTTIYTYQYR